MADGRVYGINGTAQANLQQMIFGSTVVADIGFIDTWAQIIQITVCPGSVGGGNCDQAYDAIGNAQAQPGKADGNIPLSPEIIMQGSQCFAAYNPTNASGSDAIGRAFGTSGIFW